MAQTPQILILDTGGQYCHLIARKVRELGVYAEIRPSETPASELKGARGLIISGGPASVFDPESPTIDPAVLDSGIPLLGICYGLQLIAHLGGGVVQRGIKGEYGLALLRIQWRPSTLIGDLEDEQQVWMSHRDLAVGVPEGYIVTGSTSTCGIAAMENAQKAIYGVQFHPEVAHTVQGREMLINFVHGICGCTPDWNPQHQLPQIEEQIRAQVGDRSVFFFVSGGVDSTVAFSLCLRALGRDRVKGVYVDTGLMRADETATVRDIFASLGGDVSIEMAEREFLGALGETRDPEAKRAIIGEAFVAVQQRIIDGQHLLDGNWILGQGTIYPDTIESGGSSKAAVIKTHHNRVGGIQKLIDEKRIVEPLASFYKDEVRAIGYQLGVPGAFLERHPFPGPGLAIRVLCSDIDAPLSKHGDGYIVPVRSVGVQGDLRTYAPVLATAQFPSKAANLQAAATEQVNSTAGINRVMALVDSHVPLEAFRVRVSSLTKQRVDRLRSADALVREVSHASGFDREVWQFPVLLVPVGTEECPDSVVLRPVDSVDGMTAQSVGMEDDLLASLADRLLNIEGIAGVFYDLTHKPPATIEWE